jgi:tetratricopeptide (TPR) repeat protein
MIDVVKELIVYYPKDTYVLTLAGIYSELGDTKKQLALTEVLYEKGMLNTSSHITNLGNLYLLHGLPYKAATLLEKEMNENIVESNERNLRLLSQAWYQAREDEKAIPPLERAAGMSEDGELPPTSCSAWRCSTRSASNRRGAPSSGPPATIVRGGRRSNGSLTSTANSSAAT